MSLLPHQIPYVICRPGHAAWDDRLVVGDAAPYFNAPLWAGDFMPDYAPAHMVAMGVFGDAYFGGPEGDERWRGLRRGGMPSRTRGDTIYRNIRGAQTKRLNYHGRPASFHRDWWLDRSLIYSYDPLGWFEWYCWYCLGRRIDGYDRWQIDRWRNFKTRHGKMYEATPTAGHAQALLHWAIRPPELF